MGHQAHSGTTILAVVIHIETCCCILHHKTHVTGRSLAARWLFIFLIAPERPALTRLHRNKFRIFKRPAFYSEISVDGRLRESALLKSLNSACLLFQASKYMKL